MTRERSKTSELAAIAMLAAAAMCWAGNHIVGRWIAGEHPPVPPGGLSAARWLLAFVVLLPFAWRHIVDEWPLLRQSAWVVLALGLAGGAMFGIIQYHALRHTGAVNVGVMNSVGPAFIILAGVLIFRDVVGRAQIVGIVVSLIGVLVILSHGDPDVLIRSTFNVGDLLALLNMIIFAVYSACLRLTPRLHVMTFVAALSLIAAVGSVPVAIVEAMAGQPLQATPATVVAVVYTGLFTSLVGYFTWSAGVAVLGLQRAGVFLHLVPMFGAIMSVLLLGEEPRPFHAVGLLLIIAGVSIAAGRGRIRREVS